MLTVTPNVVPGIGGRLGEQTCYPLHQTSSLVLVAGSESRRANRYTKRRPWYWWQAWRADVLTVTPNVVPGIGGRLGEQTC